MAWGLFMKAVVADNFAPAVNAVYNAPASHTGLALAAATVFFSFQIYCDFAGYSYMAIGAARVIGFDLMENFRQPYFSTSIAEFWRRWHISLSTWFRDYLYLPLGGSRVSRLRWALNILLVFAVSGLWHGANWTFVIWGLLHGMYLIVSSFFQSTSPGAGDSLTERWPAAWRFVKMTATFVGVSFAWIFFRAARLGDALYIASHLFGGLNTLRTIEIPRTALLGMTLVGAVEIIQQQEPMLHVLARQPVAWRWAIYYALTLLILATGRFVQPEFIYFQF